MIIIYDYLQDKNMFPENLLLLYQIAQILGSQIFENYIGRFLNLSDENNNLLTKLQDTTDKSQNPFATLPSLEVEPEIITISDPDFDFEGGCCFNFCFVYDSFISYIQLIHIGF